MSETQAHEETTEAQTGPPTASSEKEVAFDLGKLDLGKLEVWLKSLEPEVAMRAMRDLQRRSLDIEVPEEEATAILNGLIFQGFYTADSTVFKAPAELVLTIRSLDESEYQECVKSPLQKGESQEKHTRDRNVAFLAKSVTHISGKKLDANEETRKKYWLTRPYHMIDECVEHVTRFQHRIAKVLTDQAALGNS